MSARAWAWSLVGVVGLALRCGAPAGTCAEEAAPAKPDEARAAITKLESADFAEREAALEALKALALADRETLRPTLEAALKDAHSVETESALKQLLGSLTQSTLAVELVDPQGRPFAKHSVACLLYFSDTPHAPPSKHSGETDAQGRAEILPNLRPETGLQIESRGIFWLIDRGRWDIYSYLREMRTLVFQPGRNVIRLVARPLGSLSGRLRTADGNPVANAEVGLYYESNEPRPLDKLQSQLLKPHDFSPFVDQGPCVPLEKTTSDEHGVFTFVDLEPGTYRLYAAHKQAGFVDAGLAELDAGETAELKEPKTLAPLDDSAGLKLSIAIDVPGNEDWWATVHMQESNRDLDIPKPDGEPPNERNFTHLPSGPCHVYLAKGQQRYLVHSVMLEAGRTLNLEVREPSGGGSLSGRVTGVEKYLFVGRPAPQVNAFRMDDPKDPLKTPAVVACNTVALSADGQYRFDHLPPGFYWLNVNYSDAAALVARTRELHGLRIEVGQETHAPDLALAEPMPAFNRVATVSGSVRSGTKPVPQASLAFLNVRGEPAKVNNLNLNADGSFTAEVSGAGSVAVSAPGYFPQRITLRAESLANVAISLVPIMHADLVFQALDPQGKPVAGVTIQADRPRLRENPDNQGQSDAQIWTTGASGQVRLNGLACGKRRFAIHKPGYYVEGGREVTVTLTAPDGAAEAQTMRVTVVKNAGRLKVEAPAGTPPGAACLVLLSQPESLNKEPTHYLASAEPNGFAPLAHLEGRRFDAYCQDPSYVCEPAQLDSGTANPVVKLVPAAGLKLALDAEFLDGSIALGAPGFWDPTREPEPHSLGQLRYPVEPVRQRRYAYWGLRPGTYDVVLTPPSDARRPMMHKRASVVLPGLALPSLEKGWAAFEASDARTPDLPERKGVLAGTFTRTEPISAYCVALVGMRAFATLEVGANPSYLPDPDPVVLPDLPEALRHEPDGHFEIAGLPEGEYCLYVAPWTYWWKRHGTLESSRAAGKNVVWPEERPLRVLKIEKGQRLDLGDLGNIRDLVPPAIHALNANLTETANNEDQDLVTPDYDTPPVVKP